MRDLDVLDEPLEARIGIAPDERGESASMAGAGTSTPFLARPGLGRKPERSPGMMGG
ncbi:hypothetical protein ACGFYQ_31540 [Streptomyces sp. NPDC048258]|uniref:hypothetical protein n=1 Tax=Streptomyces sp. NPDC048258 TaxID=3365527 RepID=UPI0037153A24